MGNWPRSIRSVVVWLCPALVMLAVGLWRIGTPELWRDELSSWSAATRGLGELFGMLGRVDASIGAYYVVLHLWTEVFGTSPVALRLPSALAMAGAAAFTALSARRLFRSPTAGLAAGLLFATVPSVSRYAQETRAYALVACATAAAVWCLFRALDRPGVGRWAAFAACTSAAGLLHLVSLSALVPELAVVLLRARRPGSRGPLWQFPCAALLAVLPAVPVMLLGQQQSARQLYWVLRPDGPALWHFWSGLFGAPQVTYVFLALAGCALLRRPGPATELLLLAVLPVLVVWLASQGEISYFLDRYLLFTLPACAALAGGGVDALWVLLRGSAALRGATPARAASALTVVAVAVVLPGLLGFPAQRAERGGRAHGAPDYRGATAVLAAGYRSGDGLVAIGGAEAWQMAGPGIAYHLPPGVRPTQPFVQKSAIQADDLFPSECPAPASCIGNEPRVWVVTIGTGDDPYQGLPAEQAGALRTVFTPTEVRHVRGLTVSLLVRSRR
ncbi:glycosyltransferase family 39 protein [Kitasatospora sp. NPDC049258]|uniref:glycosyltransferase family 39 protein n=1 Tax=Kitasatospora sp. NPDC049258 TaxID=3155394 RepID=UPI00342AF92C